MQVGVEPPSVSWLALLPQPEVLEGEIALQQDPRPHAAHAAHTVHANSGGVENGGNPLGLAGVGLCLRPPPAPIGSEPGGLPNAASKVRK